jgi:hypothetical protein
MALYSDAVLFNTTGMDADGNGVPTFSGQLSFADCLVSNSTNSYVNAGTVAGSNPGTTLITPGQSSGGLLSPAIGLQ